jgi:ketosteroid isomerase-like protein
MKRILIVLAFLTGTVTLKAQTAADSVKAVINQFFDGMRNADVSMVTSSFADSAILQTIVNRQGKISIRNEPLSGFANVITQQQKGDLDEKIQFETIKIDGPMAMAWTPYKFYYKGQFSHCGVNSFQLVKINGAWKIQYIIDTRRREGCE